MSFIPTGAEVPFVKCEEEGIVIYQFDTSNGGHPMVNAMAGLQLLKDGEKLKMINSQVPTGLFPRIEDDFEIETEELVDGKFKITFTKKSGDTTTDFTATCCSAECRD